MTPTDASPNRRARSPRAGRALAAGLAAVALGVAAAPAAGATMLATYHGTVARDAFGTGGAVFGLDDIVGAAFTATFVYDTALGAVDTTDGLRLEGGPLSEHPEAPSPMAQAAFTLNGRTLTLAGDESGVVRYRTLNTGEAAVCHGVVRSGVNNPQRLEGCVAAAGATLPAAFDTPFHLAGRPVSAFLVLGDASQSLTDSPTLALVLDLSEVDIRRLDAAVPEPAAWATMIVGLFGAGAGLRRRRAARAA